MPNLEMSDRKAILQDAEGIVRRSISNHGPDIDTYRALGDVGLALAGRFSEFAAIDDAITLLQEFEERNTDPEIQKVRRSLQSQLRSIGNGIPQDDFEVGDDAALIDL